MTTKLQSLIFVLGLTLAMFARAEPDYLVDSDWLTEHVVCHGIWDSRPTVIGTGKSR